MRAARIGRTLHPTATDTTETRVFDTPFGALDRARAHHTFTEPARSVPTGVGCHGVGASPAPDVQAASGAARTSSPCSKVRMGVLGTGTMADALARHWARAGHEVLVGGRHARQGGSRRASEAARGPAGYVKTPDASDRVRR
ncbi:hypothetical protein GCM10009536_58230 [Streptomyces thermocarboxydus]